MEHDRLSTISRNILADILSLTTAVVQGPAVSPEQEKEMLLTIQARLHALMEHYSHESDSELVRRFRQTHPEMFHKEGNDDHTVE